VHGEYASLPVLVELVHHIEFLPKEVLFRTRAGPVSLLDATAKLLAEGGGAWTRLVFFYERSFLDYDHTSIRDG
jgi:hypothetical protein